MYMGSSWSIAADPALLFLHVCLQTSGCVSGVACVCVCVCKLWYLEYLCTYEGVSAIILSTLTLQGQLYF